MPQERDRERQRETEREKDRDRDRNREKLLDGEVPQHQLRHSDGLEWRGACCRRSVSLFASLCGSHSLDFDQDPTEILATLLWSSHSDDESWLGLYEHMREQRRETDTQRQRQRHSATDRQREAAARRPYEFCVGK